MTHLFIINPAAGSRDRTKEYSDKIRETCVARGLDFRIQISGAPGECTMDQVLITLVLEVRCFLMIVIVM